MEEVEAQIEILTKLYPMAFKTERIKSFRGYEDLFSVSIEELATYGFYFDGSMQNPDGTRCAFCEGRLTNWRHSDNVKEEHEIHFPYCKVFGRQNNAWFIGQDEIDLGSGAEDSGVEDL